MSTFSGKSRLPSMHPLTLVWLLAGQLLYRLDDPHPDRRKSYL
jgi:hypothetical protein